MADDESKPRKLQVATMRPGGQRPRHRPPAAKPDGRAWPRRGRRHRADRQARHAGPRGRPLSGGRGARDHPARRPPARQCRDRLRRLRRGPQGRGRSRRSASCSRRPQKNLRLHGSAHALKRSFGMKPLTAGDVVATTGQQQIMRGDIPPELQADADRAGLRAAGDPADGRVDRAQGHRPHRRQYRGRAPPRIYRGQGHPPRRRHL